MSLRFIWGEGEHIVSSGIFTCELLGGPQRQEKSHIDIQMKVKQGIPVCFLVLPQFLVE